MDTHPTDLHCPYCDKTTPHSKSNADLFEGIYFCMECRKPIKVTEEDLEADEG